MTENNRDEEFSKIHTKAFMSFDKGFQQDFLILLEAVTHGAGKLILELFDDMEKTLTKKDETTPNENKIDVDKLSARVANLRRLPNKTTPFILLLLLITQFEAYLEDIILTVFIAEPGISGLPINQIPTDEIAFMETMKACANSEFDRKRWDVIFRDFFDTKLGFNTTAGMLKLINSSPAELDEAKALRNLHVHNQGIVDIAFSRRIPNSGKNIGEYYPITMDYLEDITRKIYFTTSAIDQVICSKFPKVLQVNLHP